VASSPIAGSRSGAHGTDERACAPRDLVAGALEAIGGGALVLDEGLRILVATPAAERLLGVRVEPGAHAVKLLYGDAVERPLAEGLAAGRPTVATVERMRLDPAGRTLRVRATPLRAGARMTGWVLLVSEDTPALSDAPEELHGMWTRDVTMKRLFRLVEKVAACDASVLVHGETGTGKGSIAAALHALSVHRSAPLRVVRCAGLAWSALASELCPGGMVFLEDVEQLPLDAQAELLDALEPGVGAPSGGAGPARVDLRVVAATSASLPEAVARGEFRADLMYRMGVVTLHPPPLRARRGDVPLLVEKLVAEMNARGGRRVERVAERARVCLERHAWPGNVRELRAAMESAFVVGEGPVLDQDDLPPGIGDPTTELGEAVAHPATDLGEEARRILRALERAGGDREQAAHILGMSRTTLWRRMLSLGLRPGVAGTQ